MATEKIGHVLLHWYLELKYCYHLVCHVMHKHNLTVLIEMHWNIIAMLSCFISKYAKSYKFSSGYEY